VVLEVRPEARALLERLRSSGDLVDPAPRELRFLRRLEQLGLADLEPSAADPPPTVTVVVPVRDRPAQLAACLRSLAALDYPKDRYSVVVVDDGSRVPVRAPADVRVVVNRDPLGPSTARNRGAAAGRADVVALIDSDCSAEPAWLAKLVRELADPAVAAVGGRVVGKEQGTWLQRYEAVRSPLDLGPRRADVRPGRPVSYLVTANLAVRRDVFEALGGFNPTLRCGEDVDLVWRVVAAGHRAVYQPRARVRHDHRTAPREFVRTRSNYGASEAALRRLHPGTDAHLGSSPGLAMAAAGGLATLVTRRVWPAALGAVALAAELAAGVRSLRRETGLGRGYAASVLVRGHAASAYWAARRLSRYYGLPALALSLAAGRRRRASVLAALAAAEVATAAADRRRLGARLGLLAFTAAQALDDLAYQTGVWRGCWSERSLEALRTELRIGRQGRL
jgi:mycofactocin system glycosyltransferase